MCQEMTLHYRFFTCVPQQILLITIEMIGIDIEKSNKSKECVICNCYLLITDSNFKILYVMAVTI